MTPGYKLLPYVTQIRRICAIRPSQTPHVKHKCCPHRIGSHLRFHTKWHTSKGHVARMCMETKIPSSALLDFILLLEGYWNKSGYLFPLWFTQKAGIHDKGNNGHCCTHISYNDWLNHMKTVLCRSSQMISTVMLAFVLATLLCIRQHTCYNDWLNHMKTVLCRSSQMISTVMLAFVLATLLCIRQHTWMQSGEFCVWGHLQIQESLFPT
jgi:hypothetical protein